MTSISGKIDIDWGAFAEKLSPVQVIDEPVLVKKRSRDFFWYSPILNEQLKKEFGDLVAVPKTSDEMKHCLAIAYQADVPIVFRGGGTGNYGQAVPVNGGLIIETTAMDRIIEIGDGYVTAEAGALMLDINNALKASGQELAMFPSTQDIATVGGFVAGGSSGIGSLASGALREPGNLISLKVLSVDAEPQEHLFEGADVLKIHHAWGINGAITQVTLRTVPSHDWVACMATFDDYGTTYAATYALASCKDMSPKMANVVDARIAGYFPRLKDHIPEGRDLSVCYIPPEDLEAYKALVAEYGGIVHLHVTEAERVAANIPHAFEFAYNHTTLQVLKEDRSATYQQIGVADVSDVEAIVTLREVIGDDVWMHHEFARFDGKLQSIDLPIIWFTDQDRLDQINETYRQHGFIVYDAHVNVIEGGGLHNADYTHLAWKKRLDPKGLLNSSKSAAWALVKDLSAEEIEAKAVIKG